MTPAGRPAKIETLEEVACPSCGAIFNQPFKGKTIQKGTPAVRKFVALPGATICEGKGLDYKKPDAEEPSE